jgi:hypothetical protein
MKPVVALRACHAKSAFQGAFSLGVSRSQSGSVLGQWAALKLVLSESMTTAQ